MKVCKFGGTSMASAVNIRQVSDIIKSDADRRFIVVSAPGKRDKSDKKITDLLYRCQDELERGGAIDEPFAPVAERFLTLARGLKIDARIMKGHLDRVKAEIAAHNSRDFTASRGEYLAALLLSAYIGFDFLDAQNFIRFHADGRLDADATDTLGASEFSKRAHAVIPGFYGLLPDGAVKTFSRGGSDVTGALAARAARADVYENWTDVDGFYSADPRIVPNARIIESLSYRELRELSYMGAEVLHADSVFAVNKSGIPINVRNTFNPSASGTMIFSDAHAAFAENAGVVTGISGKKDFTVINIEKSMMNNEVGFARKILSVLEEYKIPVEHMPTGIDTLGVVIANQQKGVLDKIVDKISSAVRPDVVEIADDMALIAAVGRNMANRKGTAAALFSALAESGINVSMIDQGSGELNIIVGVKNKDYENAVKAVYNRFFGKNSQNWKQLS